MNITLQTLVPVDLPVRCVDQVRQVRARAVRRPAPGIGAYCCIKNFGTHFSLQFILKISLLNFGFHWPKAYYISRPRGLVKNGLSDIKHLCVHNNRLIKYIR